MRITRQTSYASFVRSGVMTICSLRTVATVFLVQLLFITISRISVGREISNGRSVRQRCTYTCSRDLPAFTESCAIAVCRSWQIIRPGVRKHEEPVCVEMVGGEPTGLLKRESRVGNPSLAADVPYSHLLQSDQRSQRGRTRRAIDQNHVAQLRFDQSRAFYAAR